MAAALTRVAFEVNRARFVEIRCARINEPSAKVPVKLGFTQEATLPVRIELPGGGIDDARIFTLHERDYGGSPAASFTANAFDGGGRRLF